MKRSQQGVEMTQRQLPLGELHHEHLTKEQVAIRIRLGRLLFWHTRPEDMSLSDRDFLKAVLKRHDEVMGWPLLDPNE